MINRFSRFQVQSVWKSKFNGSRYNSISSNESFENLGIHKSLQLNLKEKFGISSPTFGQSKIFPLLLANKNILFKDCTGSGKTFGLALLTLSKTFDKFQANANNLEQKNLETIFLVSSRDLAIQVYQWMKDLSLDSESKSIRYFISGRKSEITINPTDFLNTQILIVTPIALMTLLDLNVLNLSNLQLLIIDEVDRLFTKEKKSGVRSIGERLLKRIMYEKRTQQDLVHEDNSSNSMIIPLQTVFSSATINQKVVKKLETVISDLIVMDFNELEPLSSTIEHQCYYIDHDGELCSVSQEAEQSNQSSVIKAKPVEYAFADDDDKVLKGLSTIIQNENIRKALLFTTSSVSLKSMIKRIESLGLKADKLINLQNYDNPKQFEWGDVNLICATEYECRGLDLPDCTHVFILGLLATDAYVHVSGRVGRAGKKGVCISLLGGKRYVKPYLTMSKILNIKL